MTVWIEEFCIHPFVHHGDAILHGTRVEAFLPVCRAKPTIDSLKGDELGHVAQTQTLASFDVWSVAGRKSYIRTIGAIEELAITKSWC